MVEETESKKSVQILKKETEYQVDKGPALKKKLFLKHKGHTHIIEDSDAPEKPNPFAGLSEASNVGELEFAGQHRARYLKSYTENEHAMNNFDQHGSIIS